MNNSYDYLTKVCKNMRLDCLVMADAAGNSGFHFGGTLSLIEIAASLYFEVMKFDKASPANNERDRLLLSKGHGVPAIYAAYKEMGLLSEQDLRTFKTDDTSLYAHPSLNRELGIELSSGSLGQGLSQGVGIAIALKHFKNPARVFVILGDGECDEGSVWEAAMSASKYNLNNIVAIVDRNKIQYDGSTESVMPLISPEEKFKSFGWDTLSIDGHSIEADIAAFSAKTDRPLAVIANTVKGKGISFMENDPAWHHAKLTRDLREQAFKELGDYEV